MLKRIAMMSLLLVGCATTAKYEANLKTWMGHTSKELVSEWGVPTNSIAFPDGTSAIEYYKSSQGVTYSRYNASANMYQGQTFQYSCKTTFMLNKVGVITEAQYEGNSCKSR